MRGAAGRAALRRLAGAVRRLDEHRTFLLLLGIAALVRILVAVAYRPALFFGGDSSQYLKLALAGGPVGIAYERPSGYPLLIHGIFALQGRDLGALSTLQHLAGLTVGTLVYALMLRLTDRRWAALATAALVLLDAYAIALEQHVLAEAFFTLLLFGSFFLAVGRGRGAGPLALSGALLGASATLRPVSLFAIPVWLGYLLWVHKGWSTLATATVCLALPLVGYGSWHAARTGRFGLTSAAGWFLYGRIGEIGDCTGVDVPRDARALCRRVPRDDSEGAAYHLFAPQGTAHRAFGSLTGTPEHEARVNRLLRNFALAVIEHRPLRYAQIVGRDLTRLFEPGFRSRSIADTAVQLPRPGQLQGLIEPVRRPYFRSLRVGTHPPEEALRAYARWVHSPRWLMGLLALTAVASVLAGLRRRWRLPHRPETFLLGGAAIAMLVGATATSDYDLRYLVPTVPLLACGGTVAALDLAARFAASDSRRFGDLD